MSRRPTKAQIAADEAYLIDRQQRFRLAADLVVAAFARCEAVEAVSLIGSVAHPLWREVPRFAPYKRLRLPIAHECKDLDLAAWISCVDQLDELRRARSSAVNEVYARTGNGVAVHEVEVFLLEPVTDRYLGRLCYFGRCPAEKRDCWEQGCGHDHFLKQLDGFSFWPDTIAAGAVLRLYDRSTGGIITRATDLPAIVHDGDRKRRVASFVSYGDIVPDYEA